MLTEQDFENAEEAIKTIDRHYEENRITNGLRRAEKTLYDFTKKVITEARRDFLTEENPPSTLEERVKNLEDSAENMRAALERLCKLLVLKIPPRIFETEACEVIKISRGEK